MILVKNSLSLQVPHIAVLEFRGFCSAAGAAVTVEAAVTTRNCGSFIQN